MSGIAMLSLAGHFVLSLLPGAVQAKPEAVDFQKDIKPLFSKYCYKCHGPQLRPKADLNLIKYQTESSLRDNRKLARDFMTKILTREMPPEDFEAQPTGPERELMGRWIEEALSRVDPNAPKLAGRVVWRRLNRTEYRNTVRDLLGVDFDPRDFPSDDVGYGFDNIGDVLSMSPLLVEKYVAAAKKIAEQAVAGPRKDELLFTVKPDPAKPKRDAAKAILQPFLLRAFRRPPTADEVERYAKLYDAGEKLESGFEAAFLLPLRAILISPHFLFRVEYEGGATDSFGAYPINDWELASRLSYFLWGSMPDDALFEIARKSGLRNPKTLEAQVARMIKDPRSRALAENFTAQWLQIRRLEEVKFDPKQFAAFDDRLRRDMMQEPVLFLEAILKEDRSALELLDADFTFLNGRLAQHYGIGGASGDGFQRVALADGRRGGVMTMAAVLAATSDPDRTSPVKRGKWVLEVLLGVPPPPPVPDAANLKPDPADARLTLRERLEKHRKDPNCASCHNRMDPLGFGLENFDAIGAWRDREAGKPIDASAKLPDGRTFNGPTELKAIVKTRKDEFVECLVEKMLTYALGRGVEHTDGPIVRELAEAMKKGDYRLSTLVAEIAKSYPFQYRQKDRGRR